MSPLSLVKTDAQEGRVGAEGDSVGDYVDGTRVVGVAAGDGIGLAESEQDEALERATALLSRASHAKVRVSAGQHAMGFAHGDEEEA